MPRVRQKSRKNQQHQAVMAPQEKRLDDGTGSTPVTVAMIQALIPLGLKAVEDALLGEVEQLAGPRYGRGDAHPAVVRWGAQRGSIYLADQKLAIAVPRVRDRAAERELPLATYAALQQPRAQDVGLFRRVLGGISCREYAAAAEAVPEAFGLARSSVSRHFIRASARELRRLQERRLDDAEWLVLVLDGKSFAGDELVLALGVTTTGEKRLLGLVQTASENRRVIAAFLRELGERGFRLDRRLLVVLDGSKGLRAAVREVLGDVPVQRCQWHKRENVVSYLAKQHQPTWRRKLQAAYAHPAYADAKRALERLSRELRLVNASAAASLTEGLEETLTLHRLGVFPELGVSFKTTNLIESVMSRLEARTHRVTHWRTSDQKLRWCAAALWAMERHFRRVKNYRHLPLLKQALETKLVLTSTAA
ncbi:MAG TPA: transposase [Gemmatimonadaceae bacterium]|nr:transposase [Gemmatimonadaceae bacterium]